MVVSQHSARFEWLRGYNIQRKIHHGYYVSTATTVVRSRTFNVQFCFLTLLFHLASKRYWLNKLERESVDAGAGAGAGAADGRKYGVINCAVEESTVGARACSRLLDQDTFIRDHITGDDMLVVSVGGNDIALKPNPCTIVHMLSLVKCVPYCCLEHSCGTAIPVDDCCCGCGPSCLSDITAFPPGIGYFIHLFKVRIQKYIENVLGTSFMGEYSLFASPLASNLRS